MVVDWKVLKSDAGEDAECHAAKLLEVMLLQYRGLIDQVCFTVCLTLCFVFLNIHFTDVVRLFCIDKPSRFIHKIAQNCELA